MNISNELLKDIVKTAVADLKAAFVAKEAEIIKAATAVAAEREEGSPLKFSFGFGIQADLDKSKVVTAFSYNVKTTVKNETPLNDPDQPDLFED